MRKRVEVKPLKLKELKQPDMVNHAPHYNYSEIEPIDPIEDWGLGFHLGNVVKYIARAGKKDPGKEIEDLEKAEWYLKRRISQLKAQKTQ
jgi:hypothetical protein